MPEKCEVQIDDGPWEDALMLKDSYLVKRNEQYLVVSGTITAQRKAACGFIAQVPAQCYCQDQFSHDSIAWLEWVMHQQRCKEDEIFIQHAQNLGEFKVPGTNYKIDGYCQKTNVAYEYHVSKILNPVMHCDLKKLPVYLITQYVSGMFYTFMPYLLSGSFSETP